MKQVEKIEKGLHDFLLRDIVFILKNGKKPVKRGKLILFKFKEFHFVFTLKMIRVKIEAMKYHTHIAGLKKIVV